MRLELTMSLGIFYLLLLSLASISSPAYADTNCTLDPALEKEIANYQPTVDKIIHALTEGDHKGKVWEELVTFTDSFGPRLSGSKNLEDSIDYLLKRSKYFRLDNVHGEPVKVPRWERGDEKAWILEPWHAKLPITSFGLSRSTPPEGITAEAIVIHSNKELQEWKSEITGKILVLDLKEISGSSPVNFLFLKPVAVLATIQISNFSIGTLRAAVSSLALRIPVAGISIESRQLFRRLQDKGFKVKIKLKLESKILKRSVSRNAVMEVKGKEIPEKYVIVSGHTDSWDLGVGAIDDGVGSIISWYSLVLLKKLGLIPRRSLRAWGNRSALLILQYVHILLVDYVTSMTVTSVPSRYLLYLKNDRVGRIEVGNLAVLFTSEEMGLIGSKAYKRRHKGELDNITFFMESDTGVFNLQGLQFVGTKEAACVLEHVLKLMQPINMTKLQWVDKFQLTKMLHEVGTDIERFYKTGVPLGMTSHSNNSKYFWFYHSSGDYINVFSPEELDRAAALWASTAYVVAQLSSELSRK